MRSLPRRASDRGGACMQRPESDDRAWSTGVVSYWSVSCSSGLERRRVSFDSCTNAAQKGDRAGRLSLYNVKNARPTFLARGHSRMMRVMAGVASGILCHAPNATPGDDPALNLLAAACTPRRSDVRSYLSVGLSLVLPQSAKTQAAQMRAPSLNPRLLNLTSAGPNHADEPRAPELSLRKARQFLDEVALAWTRGLRCGTCRTNYAYMVGRPSLRHCQVDENPVDRPPRYCDCI